MILIKRKLVLIFKKFQDYALNHYGKPDISIFDFTSLFSAEYSCRIIERKGFRLLMSIVGDSLHEVYYYYFFD